MRFRGVSLRLVFGVSGPLGGPLMSDAETKALVHAALDHGVRVFDTAPFYGPRAEARLGAALATHPRGADALITTKAGTSWRLRRAHKDFSRDGVARSLDASARALGRERLDAVFLHGASEDELTDELLTALSDWRSAGRIGALGACGRGPELDPAIVSGVFDLLMAPAGVGLDSPGRARLAHARARGLTVFGLEGLRPALDPWRTPRKPADLWRFARTLARREPKASGPRPSIAQCMGWTLGEADLMVTSTTRRAHLETLVRLASDPAVAAPPRAPAPPRWDVEATNAAFARLTREAS